MFLLRCQVKGYHHLENYCDIAVLSLYAFFCVNNNHNQPASEPKIEYERQLKRYNYLNVGWEMKKLGDVKVTVIPPFSEP